MARILHISTRLILGGSQENTVLSCEGQALRGHDVHLAYGPIHGPEGSLFDRVAGFRTPDDRRITTHELPDLIREIRPFRDARALAQLRRLIRDLCPDVVHTHSSKAGILGRLAAFRETSDTYRPAIVHTVHGPPFMPVEGSPLRSAKTRLINECYAIAERHAARRCHLIISVADAMTEQFLAKNIGRLSQYVTVRSGIDFDPYLHPSSEQSREAIRSRLGFQPEDIVIGTVARLAEHKGHDDLLDCLPRLLRANPRIRLLWVGDGYKREHLLDRARKAGIAFRKADEHGEDSVIVLT
ncbi:MAG: glycosyltransferase, partial [bacterium]